MMTINVCNDTNFVSAIFTQWQAENFLHNTRTHPYLWHDSDKEEEREAAVLMQMRVQKFNSYRTFCRERGIIVA